jgi:hypothetical protein
VLACVHACWEIVAMNEEIKEELEAIEKMIEEIEAKLEEMESKDEIQNEPN